MAREVATSVLCDLPRQLWLAAAAVLLMGSSSINVLYAAQLKAGVAKVDITDRQAGPVNDPLYVKALVLTNNDTTAVVITVDAVAIGEIGYIGNDYLPTIRAYLEKELNISPKNVLVNASHCHGVVCKDIAARTIRAVKEATANLVPVRVGVGTGHESRVMENRRLRLKNGKEVDSRRAYSLPPDEQIAEVGTVDSEIGLLRLDRIDGSTLSVIYNFACHPIQGVPSGGNTADYVGFASKVIEDNLSDGAVALFLQGCAGDINPVSYKDVDNPRDAEPLGNLLGLSALRGLKPIETRNDDRLEVRNETIELPRANVVERMHSLKAEQQRLLQSLKGTSVNLKTFIPMVVKYNVSREFPSYYSHQYLREKARGEEDLNKLDIENRRDMSQYIQNIYTMEELTRVQTNLALLQLHHDQHIAAGERTVGVEIMAVRIGDFVVVTFPGELTVQTGIDIKKASPHDNTFVAAYTNGYIYYAPTEEQLKNAGGAQEDSDCIVGPGWQSIYEDKIADMLQDL